MIELDLCCTGTICLCKELVEAENTCVTRSAKSCLWQAVVLIYGVTKIADLQDWLTVMGFEQDILQLDVPICHSHSA